EGGLKFRHHRLPEVIEQSHRTGSTVTTHQKLWQFARTLADLGNLTADWLEGVNSYLPAYFPDDDGRIRPAGETLPLIPHLARANRNGYVTRGSQPGIALTDGCG